MGNIFKDEFCSVINNPAILTEIRIAIQNLLIQDSSNQEFVQQEDESEQQTDFDSEGE